MSEAGLQKAAVLMLALGQEACVEVMRYLEPKEVQKLGTIMSTMNSVSTESLNNALAELQRETGGNRSFSIDSSSYVTEVLTKALGDDKASSLINRILTTSASTGIDNLKWMDPKSVAEFISNEHPQIIATILLHLDPLQASEILAEFSERTRIDTILRIATLDSIQPLILNDLNDVLNDLLTGNDVLRTRPIGGIRATAAIMNFFNSNIESVLMSKLKEFDEDLANQINDKMFVFDDIIEISDRDIQTILIEIPSESLIIALKGAKENIKTKILKNMSERAAEMLAEDLNAKGPVRLSDVEKEQKEILKIIKRLVDEGQITLQAGGDDAYV
jgi:flagellar motor switch protein FliG